jgi:hypothetical protein
MGVNCPFRQCLAPDACQEQGCHGKLDDAVEPVLGVSLVFDDAPDPYYCSAKKVLETTLTRVARMVVCPEIVDSDQCYNVVVNAIGSIPLHESAR